MSEAIILYRGRGGVDTEILNPQVITNNGEYVAPVTGTYWIGVVGGGGGGGGGCMNAAGSGQFYGAGGTRGTLNTKSITLNAGDRVSVSLGAGGATGTNNTSKTTYSNGCNNSMGTSGSTGSTTTFGSYSSGSGGSGGTRSWSYQWWYNYIRWNNIITGWDNGSKMYHHWYGSYTEFNCGELIYSMYHPHGTGSVAQWGWICSSCGIIWTGSQFRDPWYGNQVSHGQYNDIVVNGSSTNTPIWSNQNLGWSNTKQNATSGCYTSIQQGTWWYQASNNQVSTSGTRTYRGDGGASGRVGNAGFIVIIPPTI